MMTIGELAEAAGVGVETIHFYERKKLIAQPKRPRSGFRRYDHDAARRIQFIGQARASVRFSTRSRVRRESPGERECVPEYGSRFDG
jgi:DNA-binding transcriptional MerR regulator